MDREYVESIMEQNVFHKIEIDQPIVERSMSQTHKEEIIWEKIKVTLRLLNVCGWAERAAITARSVSYGELFLGAHNGYTAKVYSSKAVVGATASESKFSPSMILPKY